MDIGSTTTSSGVIANNGSEPQKSQNIAQVQGKVDSNVKHPGSLENGKALDARQKKEDTAVSNENENNSSSRNETATNAENTANINTANGSSNAPAAENNGTNQEAGFSFSKISEAGWAFLGYLENGCLEVLVWLLKITVKLGKAVFEGAKKFAKHMGELGEKLVKKFFEDKEVDQLFKNLKASFVTMVNRIKDSVPYHWLADHLPSASTIALSVVLLALIKYLPSTLLFIAGCLALATLSLF